MWRFSTRGMLSAALPSAAGPTRSPSRRSIVGTALAALLLASVGCSAVTKALTKPWNAPEVEVTSLRPVQIGLQQQTLLIGLRIRNPNDRALPIDAMSYRLSLEGEEIAAGSGELRRRIPAFGEGSAEVSVISDAARLAAKLPALMLQSRPWRYRITGTVTLVGAIPIPYGYAGEIDPNTLLRAALRHGRSAG